MGDSKKQGDPKSDQIEQPNEIAQTDEKLRNFADEAELLDERDELLSFKNDRAGDDDSSSLSQEPDSSEILDSTRSNQEALKPPRPVDTDEVVDVEFIVLEGSEPVQDSSSHSNRDIPLQKSNDNTQDDDLFDLLGEDSEVSSADETISGNSGSDDTVYSQLDSQDQLEDADDLAASESSDSGSVNESIKFKIESGSEAGLYKGAENLLDSEQVAEQEFESEPCSEVELELDDDTHFGHELDVGPDHDLESFIEEEKSVRSKDPNDDPSYEKEFFEILNEETVATRKRATDNRSIDDSADPNVLGELDDTELCYEVPAEVGVSQSEIDAETETQSSTIRSVLSDAAQGIAQDQLYGSENDSVPPGVEKQPAQNEAGKNSRSKLVSNLQNGARESLEINLEEDEEMKWFTIGIPIVLVVVLMVMGGYMFSLQSQIDELHLLLPLDQENVFGSDTLTSGDLANDAIIENINARIDNLADTLELIANANQGNDGNPANESLLQPDSGSSHSDNSGTANRVAAVLAGEAKIGELNSRLDGLSKSLETITATINKQGSQIKKLNILVNSKALRAEGLKKVVPSPPPVAKNQISRGSGAVVTRGIPPIEEPSARQLKKSLKPLTAAKPAVEKGEWLVNLMSLKDETVATKQLASFRKRGVFAEINRKNISGKIWYRVQVPGFKTKQQAKKYAASVKKKLGLSSTWVTR